MKTRVKSSRGTSYEHEGEEFIYCRRFPHAQLPKFSQDRLGLFYQKEIPGGLTSTRRTGSDSSTRRISRWPYKYSQGRLGFVYKREIPGGLTSTWGRSRVPFSGTS